MDLNLMQDCIREIKKLEAQMERKEQKHKEEMDAIRNKYEEAHDQLTLQLNI